MHMQRTSPPLSVFLAVFVAGTLLGYALRGLPQYLGLANAAAVLEAPYDETPDEALARILKARKVINVHEHVQDMKSIGALLPAMDQNGIGKSLLMGSSWFTVTMNDRVGFTRYDENNEELVRIAQRYPQRFEAWPTINPRDPMKLEKIRGLIQRGATGVKLYLGHGYVRKDTGDYMFHTMAMDDPEMFPLYEYWEDNNVPLCFHVNPHKPGFADEFIEVLGNFPNLKINAPHFMLSSIKSTRLMEYLDTFPNLYSDISFGHDTFLIAGLKRISEDPDKFRALFNRYPNRFMFGTDLVMTNIPSKTVPWFTERARAYYDMLTKKKYTTPFIPDITLRGLELRGPLLDNILYRNYERFSASHPKGTRIRRKIDWSEMGVEKLPRRPGQAFPPGTKQ